MTIDEKAAVRQIQADCEALVARSAAMITAQARERIRQPVRTEICGVDEDLRAINDAVQALDTAEA
jgi:hypothetical protein